MTEYEIFKSCFPQLDIDEASFEALAFGDDIRVMRENGAFACTDGGRITLLCTAPQFRGNGCGSRLLSECEKYAVLLGKDSVTLGGGILPGAAEGSADFFAERGYRLGGDFVEMMLDLGSFSVPQAEFSDDVQFGFYSGDMDKLRGAVAKVDEEWVQYFNEDCEFFCGFVSGELACFCIVGDETCLMSDGNVRIGSIGCVGTLPQFRRRGLGLHMVALAAQQLKQRGCDSAFIHYTHLEKWYARLGARTVLRFSAAEKELR